jgi:holliday junction DNA helicase RuvB
MLKELIGQEEVKDEMGVYLEAYESSRVLNFPLFIAKRGQGKTVMAKAVGRELKAIHHSMGWEDKKIFLVNSSSIKNVDGFAELYRNKMQDKCSCIIFDEAHEIPESVQNLMLTICDPDSPKTSVTMSDGSELRFDFTKLSFVFCTTEPQGIFHALFDRLDDIHLREYTSDEFVRMAKSHAPNVNFDQEALIEAVSTRRGNGRAIKKFTNLVVRMVGDNGSFSRKDWRNMVKRLHIKPLGLNQSELMVLGILHVSGCSPLSELSYKTELTTEAMKDTEGYLRKMGLMSVTPKGRVITERGCRYLDSLDTWHKTG